CLVQIKCGASDWCVMAVGVAFLIVELCVQGGVTR
ncbi:MAG: energy-coupling factor transporter transmembrane protein EcfT, partial [Peptococcaceae bacterium]|nr:energy-coupling factor transporter transmembrane protein EcfT [Peptococcaceae bacterium]